MRPSDELARVTALNVYPVKSTAALPLHRATVHPWGFDGDRRWAIIDERGKKVTAREQRRLLHVRATPHADGSVTLVTPGMPPVTVPEPLGGDPVTVQFSGLDTATRAGYVADTWLADVLGSPVQLVWLDDPRRREVGGEHGGRHGDSVNLADSAPVHVTSLPSLRLLNEQIATGYAERGEEVPEPLPVTRFRSNVVVDGPMSYSEDDWTKVRIGGVDFRFAEPCDRCVMTTIDPTSLQGGKEPLRTLARHRKWDGKVWFGIKLIPLTCGEITVGDSVAHL